MSQNLNDLCTILATEILQALSQTIPELGEEARRTLSLSVLFRAMAMVQYPQALRKMVIVSRS